MALEQHRIAADREVVTDLRRNVGFFEQDRYKRLGDADSAHGVLFGRLSNLGSVAVKPFGDPGRARGESDSLKRIAEAGFEALEPLAVAKGGLATYLITRRRPGLRHLGQVDWRANVASPQVKNVILPTLADTASTLSGWHNKGIFNGDAQIKNMVFDKRTGASVFVDAERTQFNPSGSESVRLGDKDLWLFGVSTLSRGLLQDRSASYRAGFLAANLLDPYLDSVTYPLRGATAEDRRDMIEDRWTRAVERGWQPQWARVAAAEAAATQPQQVQNVPR